MKRTLDELLAAVDSIVGDRKTEDAVLAFIEDLSDTLTAEAPEAEDSALAAELEAVKAELEAQKQRYYDRFMGRVSDEEPEEEAELETEETAPDGNKITVKDQFKKKED